MRVIYGRRQPAKTRYRLRSDVCVRSSQSVPAASETVWRRAIDNDRNDWSSYRDTDRQTDRQTDREQLRQTHTGTEDTLCPVNTSSKTPTPLASISCGFVVI